MNLFVEAGLKVYAGNWKLKESRMFNEDEIEYISKCVVVESQYGKSVEFWLRQGGRVYIPLDHDLVAKASVGAELDIRKMTLLTLCKSGEKDIDRIEYPF